MKTKFALLAFCALVLAPQRATTGFPVIDLPNLAQSLRDMAVQAGIQTANSAIQSTIADIKGNALALARGTPTSWGNTRNLIGSFQSLDGLGNGVLQAVAGSTNLANIPGFGDPATLTVAGIQQRWTDIASLDTSADVLTSMLSNVSRYGTEAVNRYQTRRTRTERHRGEAAAGAAAKTQAAAELAAASAETVTKNAANQNQGGLGLLPSAAIPGDTVSPEQKLLAAQVTQNNLLAAVARERAVATRVDAAATERLQTAVAERVTAAAHVRAARENMRADWVTYVAGIGPAADAAGNLNAWLPVYTSTASGWELDGTAAPVPSSSAAPAPALPATIGTP